MHNSQKHNIGHTAFLMHMAFRNQVTERMSELGLNKGESFALIFLSVHGPECLVDLAHHFGIAHPSMLRHVDTLEKNGLVERVPDPSDRRKKKIQITAAGREMLPKVTQHLQEVNEEAIKGVSPEDVEQFVHVMGKIIANLKPETSDK